MTKFSKSMIAVALAAAIAVSFCFSASAAYLRDDGAFGVVSSYPTSDKLPYGENSVVIEFNRAFYDSSLNKYGYFIYDAYRLNCAADSVYFVGMQKYTNYVLYTVTVISDSPVYICNFDYGGDMSQTAYSLVADKYYTTTLTEYGNMAMSKKDYTFSFGCVLSTSSNQYKDFYVHSNRAPAGVPTSTYFTFGGGTYSTFNVYSAFLGSSEYPAKSNGFFESNYIYNIFPIANQSINNYDNANGGFWTSKFPAFQLCKYPEYSVKEDISKAAEDIKQNQDKNASEIVAAVDRAVTAIIEAGAEMSGLDTDNNWMTEALSKVNSWLDSLDDFNDSMDDNLEENQSNMAQAKTFINGIFGVMPKAIIAVMSLILVIIVVVKIIGR